MAETAAPTRRANIDSPAEYALYALALNRPDLFEEAERFFGSMLAEDQHTVRRVKALMAASAQTA